MDDIKLFAKNEKELETLVHAERTYSQDIGMEFSIEKCTIIIMRSGKRQMTEGIEQSRQEKNQNTQRKGNLQFLGNIGRGHHPASGDERKDSKRVPQENEKTTQNQTVLQKPHQRDKHLGCPPCKILGTIFNVE